MVTCYYTLPSLSQFKLDTSESKLKPGVLFPLTRLGGKCVTSLNESALVLCHLVTSRNFEPDQVSGKRAPGY